jgi:hypothetical protein
VVECPECGEPGPFLGLFLRAGRGESARLWRLEWVSRAPAGFARWIQRFCPRWRRAREIYVNHCAACGAPLADPLGFQRPGGWLCDLGIDVAVSLEGGSVTAEGFSPGAVVLPGGAGLWEDALRLTPRDFRRRFRDLAGFSASSGRAAYRLLSCPPPHRWRLLERCAPGVRPAVDEVFFSFPRAKEAARARWGVAPHSWRSDD